MKNLLILFCLLGIFSCTQTSRITRTEYDKTKQLYFASIENKPGKVYLRDDNNNLIRTEKDKENFISNYNKYWSLDKKDRTNSFYNNYWSRVFNRELLEVSDRAKGYKLTALYFSGIKNMELSNYSMAIKDFDDLISSYSNIQKYSDVLFLKAYCYEKMNDNTDSISNYKMFINQSVQRYSAIFSENPKENTNYYDKELGYSNNSIHNSNNTESIFPRDVLSNDTPKFYNGDYYSPGFDNYTADSGAISKGIGFNVGFVNNSLTYNLEPYFIIPLTPDIYFNPSINLSQYYISAEIKFPIQVYKSDDHRFGFEITPVFNYYHYYQGALTNNNQAALYEINDNFFNFGLEASAGFYIIPALYAGLSVYYTYFNQFNNYSAADQINGQDYSFNYWTESYYLLTLRYYLFRDIGVETALRNNDILVGFVFRDITLDYDISANQIMLGYGTLF